jgi:molecular chaperone DnaJ
MVKEDYYKTLGVDRNADDMALKKAFREKAMRWHPDKNPGNLEAEQRFKEVNEAYEVLKDPQKRATFDRYGHEAVQQRGGFGGGGFSNTFSDLFEEFFTNATGGGGNTSGAHGADLRYNLDITLEEAFAGKQATLRFPSMGDCDACDGTGAETGSKPITCQTCGGLGRVRAQAGLFAIERTCPTCSGSGTMIEKPCKQCRGQGRMNIERTVQVNIPPGVDEGTRLRLTGEGEQGFRGGSAGDLYVFLSIKPHKFFGRHDATLTCTVPLPFVTAALGGDITLPSINGEKLTLPIPEGTQSGDKLIIKGQGMPKIRSTLRGDLEVDVQLETPTNLSKEQKELLEQFAATLHHKNNCQPKTDSFFGKLKELWQDLTD